MKINEAGSLTNTNSLSEFRNLFSKYEIPFQEMNINNGGLSFIDGATIILKIDTGFSRRASACCEFYFDDTGKFLCHGVWD